MMYFLPVVLSQDTSSLTPEEIVNAKIEEARRISRLLMEIPIPLSRRSPEHMTVYYLPWIYNFTYDFTDVYFEIQDNSRIRVDVNAEIEKVVRGVLKTFIDSGDVVETEVTDIIDLLENSKGTRIPLESILSSHWMSLAKSYEYLQKEGWFPPDGEESEE